MGRAPVSATIAARGEMGQHTPMCARSLSWSRSGTPWILGAICLALVGSGGCWSTDDGPLGSDPPPERTLPAERSQPSSAASGTQGRVRVVSYNIAGGRLGLDRVRQTLSGLGADLIGLQEVWQTPGAGAGTRGDQASYLAKSLGLRYAFGAHLMVKTPVEGVALLSRYPLSEVAVVPTPPGKRVLLKAVAQTPKGRLTVLVLHLRAVGMSGGERRAKYLAQRRTEALLAAAQAARTQGPLLAMGDLNDTPGSSTLAALAPPLADACAGLTDRTWPSGLPILRLDHILIRSPVRSQGCQVVQSTASDHRPLVTEIGW